MRENLIVPIFIYGCFAGLMNSLNLAKSNKRKEKEVKSVEESVELMVGSELSAKKSFASKIVWFTFLMYIVYSLSLVYVFFHHPFGRLLALFLFTVEIIEHILHLKQIKKARSFDKIMIKGRFSNWSSVFHLIGIACLLGLLI